MDISAVIRQRLAELGVEHARPSHRRPSGGVLHFPVADS
jgi:hypothetical protein